MVYLKTISVWLTDYVRNAQRLKEKQQRYNELEKISPERVNLQHEKLSGTNKVHNPTETRALMLAELKGDIERLQNSKEFIDYSITKLKPLEQKVIMERYLNPEPLSWSDISKRVELSERQCITIRNNAIEKIERELF